MSHETRSARNLRAAVHAYHRRLETARKPPFGLKERRQLEEFVANAKVREAWKNIPIKPGTAFFGGHAIRHTGGTMAVEPPPLTTDDLAEIARTCPERLLAMKPALAFDSDGILSPAGLVEIIPGSVVTIAGRREKYVAGPPREDCPGKTPLYLPKF